MDSLLLFITLAPLWALDVVYFSDFFPLSLYPNILLPYSLSTHSSPTPIEKTEKKTKNKHTEKNPVPDCS